MDSPTFTLPPGLTRRLRPAGESLARHRAARVARETRVRLADLDVPLRNFAARVTAADELAKYRAWAS